MGLPVISAGTETREQAITGLIESVALQKASLSNILNAESEKMQAVLGMDDLTPEQLLELSGSVQQMINAITRLEIMLQSKLDIFSSELLA